jgi:hypothetical protein
VADEAIYSCLQMLVGMATWRNILWHVCYVIGRLGPGGGTSEILKEILSKMIIDKQNYKPAVK